MSRNRVVPWVRVHRRPAQPLVVERKDGKVCSRRPLRSRAGSRRGRRGRPVLQEPVLAAADGERRNRPGFRVVLLKIPETSMSATVANAAHTAPLLTDVTTLVRSTRSSSTARAPARAA